MVFQTSELQISLTKCFVYDTLLDPGWNWTP
jgi:hypothetical protein